MISLKSFILKSLIQLLINKGLNVIRNLSVTTTQIKMNGEYFNFQSIFYSNTHIIPDFWEIVSQDNIETFHGYFALYQTEISESLVNGLKDNQVCAIMEENIRVE